MEIIRIDQVAAIAAGITDIRAMAVFSVIEGRIRASLTDKGVQDGCSYVRVTSQDIQEELPCLNLTERTVRRLVGVLEKAGMVVRSARGACFYRLPVKADRQPQLPTPPNKGYKPEEERIATNSNTPSPSFGNYAPDITGTAQASAAQSSLNPITPVPEAAPQPPHTRGTQASAPDCERFRLWFNNLVSSTHSRIPQVSSMDGGRGAMLAEICRIYGKKQVVATLVKCTEMDFCNGGNNRGWVATIDWLLSPGNFRKCLEGAYDNRVRDIAAPNPVAETRDRDMEARQRRYAEWRSRAVSRDEFEKQMEMHRLKGTLDAWMAALKRDYEARNAAVS